MRSRTHLIANDPRKSNRVMAYIIPPILIAVAIFSCYVWYDMSVEWYLRNGRIKTGSCLLAFQILLLLLMAASYFQIFLTPAGYIPNRADRERVLELGPTSQPGPSFNLETAEYPKVHDRAPSDAAVQQFMTSAPLSEATVFIARADPSDQTRYCATCDVEKHDRVHHCSEVNRCVKKFDHYCPWVGGTLGHTRYKFFFLFITYVALYCVLLVVTLSIAVAQRRSATRDAASTQHIPDNPGLWYACIAIAGFFAFLMVPFAIFHAHQIGTNKTTIESVEIRPIQLIVSTRIADEDGETLMVRQRITLDQGVNPFDLGLHRNLQEVLGPIILDKWVLFRYINWLLPINGR